jgi:lysophospholipase L1-like esterase
MNMNRKFLLPISILLNISLLILVFQLRDKIFSQIFPTTKVKILLIGDSLLAQENWNNLLGKNDIKNDAFGGAITQQILWNIERGELVSNPKIVVINGGINDLLSGVPTQRIFSNYQKIIEVLQKRNIKIIAHLVLYTVDNESINKEVFILNFLLKEYFESQKIEYVDMNIQLSNYKKLKNQFSFDGIHLRKEAYIIWADELKSKLPQEL